MNSFRNGTWSFKAQVEPSGKPWEVTYYSHVHSRDAVMRFVDEIAAKEFAYKHGGTVREIKPRPFTLRAER